MPDAAEDVRRLRPSRVELQCELDYSELHRQHDHRGGEHQANQRWRPFHQRTGDRELRMRLLKRNIPVTAAILVSVAAMSVAAVAQSGDAPPGEGVPHVTAVEAAAQQAMEVLDTARTSSAAISTDIAPSIDHHASFGMNPYLSRETINTNANDV